MVHSIVKPSNINPATSKWLVDEPVININGYFANEILETYKKTLSKSFGPVTSIRDTKVGTMSKAVKNNLKALAFYEEQTSCDYVIETEVKTVKNELPNFQVHPDKTLEDELYIRIMVYDLHLKSLVFDKEYRFIQSFTRGNDIAFAAKTEKFYKQAIQSAIKSFQKKYNWREK